MKIIKATQEVISKYDDMMRQIAVDNLGDKCIGNGCKYAEYTPDRFDDPGGYDCNAKRLSKDCPIVNNMVSILIPTDEDFLDGLGNDELVDRILFNGESGKDFYDGFENGDFEKIGEASYALALAYRMSYLDSSNSPFSIEPQVGD
jgi:hypothetical protein